MRWNRIVFKLGATIIFLFLVVLLPLGFVIDKIFSGFYFSQVQEDIERLSSRYAEAIAQSNNPMAVDMIEMMAEFSQVYLYIVDAKGKIVANAGIPSLPEGTWIPQEEIDMLARKNSIQKEYEDPLSGNRFLVSGKPIITEGNVFYGGVYVLSSIEAIHQSVQRVRDLLILSGTGAFFLALGFTFVLSRKLSDPLIAMERATRQIAKGKLDTRVNVTSGDELGSLAEAINDLAKNLQRYHDTRKEFFANISHELRTPITYIEGYAKILRDGLYESEEEKKQYLEIIHQEAKRLTRMIEDLFELSKMEEGKLDLHRERIDLAEVMENAVRKAHLRVSRKGLKIELDIEDDLPFVYGDGLRMEQIFINLLDNAIRYTEHGKISIKMWREEQNWVMIQIEDTGIGIPEHEIPFIFERFYRVEKSRSREYGGTGLGLAIVKQLVEWQGGEIRVFSEVGKGTRFQILFPAEPAKSGEAER
ncbi:HAMP domain-containing sensor histidine kinase [Bacillaceae bacterium]